MRGPRSSPPARSPGTSSRPSPARRSSWLVPTRSASAQGALVPGVPFASGIALLVFIGSFIPVVGALLSGFVAVALAFVAKGPITALLMLGVVIAVQQLESHVLQPLLPGRAVRVHPLAVILGIATGIIVGGIIGALTAVPLVAVLNAVGHNLLEPTPEDVEDPADLVTDVEHAEITEDIAEADELARPDRESPPHDA
uniref:AI-2E family transporter n=1 Tax=Janibacter limosus TaxID=53458 RepID=A0AC61U5L7_9MICO